MAGSSYSDELLAKNPMWSTMGLHGLQDFEKPFQVKLANLVEAREQAQLEACTRVRIETTSSAGASPFVVVSPFGRPISALDRFPFFRAERRSSSHEGQQAQPRDFGCSIAVSLYLRFNVEFAALMLLAFLVSVPHINDNIRRNELRNQCRVALSYDYDALVAGAPSRASVFFGTNATADELSSSPDWYESCGYRGKPLRHSISPLPGDMKAATPNGKRLTYYDLGMDMYVPPPPHRAPHRRQAATARRQNRMRPHPTPWRSTW